MRGSRRDDVRTAFGGRKKKLRRNSGSSSSIDIEIQFAVSRRGVPHPNKIRTWIGAVTGDASGSLCVRIVGVHEMRVLNRTWRAKDKPTNVLSFAYPQSSTDPQPASLLLGDIVICTTVVVREAREQGKPLQAHWAHMVVHGVLHLRGYDHVKNRDAIRMEALEIEILSRLGFQNPYLT